MGVGVAHQGGGLAGEAVCGHRDPVVGEVDALGHDIEGRGAVDGDEEATCRSLAARPVERPVA